MPIVSLQFAKENDNRPHCYVAIGNNTLLALIDTGASFSCIAESKAEELGLKKLPTKFKLISSAGICEMPVYLLEQEIILPNNVKIKTQNGEIKTYRKTGSDADFIIGMDILGMGLLNIQFDRRIAFGL